MNFREIVLKDAYTSVDVAFTNYENLNLEDKMVYGDWLAQTHHYVHHVTRILAFAAAKCDLYQERELHFRLIKALNEEKNHDIMAANDLKNLGLTVEQFPERMETRNFYQALFYMIETYGPYALVGYFIPQEGLSCIKLPDVYKRLVEVYGKKSCTFLMEHCELDIEHFGDALSFIKTIPENKLTIVQMGMTRSAELYADLMKSIGTTEDQIQTTPYWNIAKTKMEFNQTIL